MPALGKTRLVLELSGRPEFVDATLLQGQCHEIFASTPLYPIGVFLWGRAGLTADDEESVRHDKISGYLEELGRNTPENRDLVASLLGMAAPDSGTAAAATPPAAQAGAVRVHRLDRRAGRARATADPLDRGCALAGPVIGRTAARHRRRLGEIARARAC